MKAAVNTAATVTLATIREIYRYLLLAPVRCTPVAILALFFIAH